jgi:uncharacterized protein YeeX (DUF496 family)
MSVFIEQDNQVLIDPELKLIPEFKKIIERDKDRFKKQARAELHFVYLMCDHKSPYVKNTSESERIAKLAKELRFDNGWTPDADLVFAMERYRRLQRTATTDTLESIREGLMTSNKVINILRGQIDEAIKDVDSLAQNPALIEALVDNLDRLIKLGVAVPKIVDTIASMEEKVKKEQSNQTVKLKGGGTKGNYEE